MGLMLALARHLPAADAAMKQGKWEKKKFLGEEVRGQDARPRRPRAHRPGSRAPRRGVRHADHRARSVHLANRSPPTSASSWCRSTTCSRAPTTCRCTCRRTPQTRTAGQRRAAGAGQEGPAHHQHRARRSDRRGGAGRRDRGGPGRRRGARRLREGADGRSPAAEAAAGRRHAAHRRVDARRPGTGRRGDGRGAARLPEGRHDPQRRQLPVGVAPRSSSGCSRSSTLGERLGHVRRADERRTASTSVSVRYYGELAQGTHRHDRRTRCWSASSSRSSRPASRRERAQRGRRARHRGRRIAQHAAAQLHQPDLGEAAHAARANAGSKARCSSARRRGSCWWTASPSKRRSKAR